MGTCTVSLTFLVCLVSHQYTTAIRCLSCNDVIQPRHCSIIKHCPDGDSCLTEAYRNENREYLFNLGCMSAQRCSLTNTTRSAGPIGQHVQSLCTECCHSDLCNAAGCDTDGFPSRRGPICLDCPQSRDPADCDVISVCTEGEFCHVEETHQFGDVFYKTGCLRNFDCASPPIYNPVEVGRRSTRRDNCFSCCSDDLCNTQCNVTTSAVPSTLLTTTQAPTPHGNVTTSAVPSTLLTTTQAPTPHGSSTSSNPVTCEDKSPDCDFYKIHLRICSDIEAATRMGCYKTCDLCGNVTTSAVLSTLLTTTLAPTHHDKVTTSFARSATVTTPQTPLHHDFKGKEIFLMFLENYSYFYSLIKLSAILTFASPNAQMQVKTSGNSTKNHVSGPVELIDIDANMTMRENGKTSKGIIVTSDTPMSVTAFNLNFLGLFEGFHALPMESLGVSYIVGTFKPENLAGSSFAVGAPYDNTEVNITLSKSAVSVPGQYHREGDTITVVLDRLDTFYIETHTTDQDLTGTRIVSDKPVAVISGNLCSNGQQHCNHLVEYLPPVSKWGSRFMIPPIVNTTRGVIRIVSSVNNTNVDVTTKGSNKTYTISTFIDIDTNSTQPYAISSDEPVMVLLFPIKSSIAMTLVPSTDQFSHDPVLISPPTNTKIIANYIVVSIPSSDLSGLQLRSADGTDLPRVGSVDFPDADGEMYSFISVTCNTNQTCSVQHSDDNVTFSVISYGLGESESYAYPANIML